MFIKHLIVFNFMFVYFIACGGCSQNAPAEDGNSDSSSETSVSSDSLFDSNGTDTGSDWMDTDGESDSGSLAVEATISLTGVSVYANCNLGSGPDPIIAFWDVEITAAKGDFAVLSSAKVRIDGPVVFEQNLEIDITEIPLVNGTGSGHQRKTGADVNPPSIEVCTSMCDVSMYTLKLVYTIDGQAIDVVASGAYQCWY